MSKRTRQIGIPRAPCSGSQCLCDIFILRSHRLLKLSMPTSELLLSQHRFSSQSSLSQWMTQPFIGRGLEMSLVPPFYPLCRIDQCICGLCCSFQHLLSRPSSSPPTSLTWSPSYSILVSWGFIILTTARVVSAHQIMSLTCWNALPQAYSSVYSCMSSPSIPVVSSCAGHPSLCTKHLALSLFLKYISFATWEFLNIIRLKYHKLSYSK